MYLLLAGGIAMSVLGLVPQLRKSVAGYVRFTNLVIRVQRSKARSKDGAATHNRSTRVARASRELQHPHSGFANACHVRNRTPIW